MIDENLNELFFAEVMRPSEVDDMVDRAMPNFAELTPLYTQTEGPLTVDVYEPVAGVRSYVLRYLGEGGNFYAAVMGHPCEPYVPYALPTRMSGTATIFQSFVGEGALVRSIQAIHREGHNFSKQEWDMDCQWKYDYGEFTCLSNGGTHVYLLESEGHVLYVIRTL